MINQSLEMKFRDECKGALNFNQFTRIAPCYMCYMMCDLMISLGVD